MNNNNKLDFNKIKEYWEQKDQQSLVFYMIIDKLNSLDEEQKKMNVYIHGISAWSFVGKQLIIILPVVLGVIGLFLTVFRGAF